MQLARVTPNPTIVPTPISPPLALLPKVAPVPNTAAPFILFGLDQRGRPHAALLTGYETTVVERAADHSDLFCLATDTDALRSLSAKLPAGRIFPKSGKALVPFCSGATYDRLITAAGIAASPRPVKAAGKPADGGGGAGGGQGKGAGGSGAGDPPAAKTAKLPFDWDDIAVGSVVLAPSDGEDDGYYPATVVATRADNGFVMIWRDYPDLPEFSRHRLALGLLHPGTLTGASRP